MFVEEGCHFVGVIELFRAQRPGVISSFNEDESAFDASGFESLVEFFRLVAVHGGVGRFRGERELEGNLC